ncbi:MAG: TIGR03089 family protein [Egibacteraceae bacterium]
MHRQVRTNGHSPFLTFYDDRSGERTELSYATFDNWVAKTANLLSEEFEAGRATRVAVALRTHWTAVVVAFAAWRVGACVAPIPIDQPGVPARLDELLSMVRPDVVVASEEVAGELAYGAPVVAIGGGFGGRLTIDVPGALPYAEQVLAFGDDFEDPDVVLDDPALLVVPPWSGGGLPRAPWSGGGLPPDPLTTGPAAIVLDQGNLLAGALALIDWGGLSAQDRLLSAAPLGPVDGLVLGLLAPFLCGGASVLVGNVDPSRFARKVRDERVTWALPPGALLDNLPSVRGDDLGPLQGLLCPAGVPQPVRRAIADRTGLRVRIGHGVAAATCASTLEPVDLDDDTGAWLDELDGVPVGSPTAWAEVTEHRGELCVRGPVVMARHDGRPDLDELAFAGGWLHTGETGVVLPGPDGRLHVLVR